MKSPFALEIAVEKQDIDALGHVNNVVYVRWVQQVAEAHWQQVASPQLHARYSWVVLRHEIDYKSAAFLDDMIVGTTWVGEAHGARFERFVKLVRKSDNTTLAEAKTIWCMLDGKTMKPTRITEEVTAVL